HAVLAEADIEVWREIRVGQVDAGVEGGDPHTVSGEAGLVRPLGVLVVAEDPRDARWDGVRGDLERPDGHDRPDVRVVAQRVGGLVRAREDKPVERVTERPPGDSAGVPREARGELAGIAPGAQRDDPATGR